MAPADPLAEDDPLSQPLAFLERSGLDACDLDDRATIRKALALASKSSPRAAIVLAVRAGLMRVDGDVPQAIRQYRRALEAEPAPNLRAAILEDLISLEGSRHELETSNTDTALAMALADHAEHVGLRSVRAIMRARRRDPEALADIEDVVERAVALSDVPRARILQRASVAAYFTAQYGLMQRLAIESADLARRGHAHRIAARAFFQLYVHALGVTCDPQVALYYATEAGISASIAEDKDIRQLALSAEYALEAESGNRLRVADLREQLKRDLHLSTYHDFALRVADVLWYAWHDNWEAAKATLDATTVSSEEQGEVAVHGGLRALVSLALGDGRTAVRAAGMATTLGRPERHDSAHTLRYRHLARVLGAAALAFGGKHARAGRVLLAKEFALGAPAGIKTLAATIENGRVADLRETATDVYGYGLLLAAVRRRLYDDSDDARLTARELQLLVQRSQGASPSEIAKREGISRDAIMKRQQSAVAKLEVPNIIAAISEARRRGLLP